MGAAFERMNPAGPNAGAITDIWDYPPPGGVVWIVGRTIPRPGRNPEIHIQGASLTEAGAAAMVIDESYFIAPLPIDILLPEKPLPWYGLKFPLKRE